MYTIKPLFAIVIKEGSVPYFYDKLLIDFAYDKAGAKEKLANVLNELELANQKMKALVVSICGNENPKTEDQEELIDNVWGAFELFNEISFAEYVLGYAAKENICVELWQNCEVDCVCRYFGLKHKNGNRGRTQVNEAKS